MLGEVGVGEGEEQADVGGEGWAVGEDEGEYKQLLGVLEEDSGHGGEGDQADRGGDGGGEEQE